MRQEKYCPRCEEYRVTKVAEREQTYTVRGREVKVTLPTEVCNSCGENVGTDRDDQKVLDTVYAEFRRQMDLLTPEEIRRVRERYQLSQKSFAALLGMSEATINRYEHGALQDQAHDQVIRDCMKPEIVRDLLNRRGSFLSEWQRKRAEGTLAGQAGSDSRILDSDRDGDCTWMPQEISELTGFRRFDYERFATAVIWFCRRLGKVSTVVINKLLFYTDFLNYKTSTVSLTGAAYRSLAYGPVLADYGGLLSRMESEELLVSEERVYSRGNVGVYYQAGPKADSVKFGLTAHEIKVMEHVADALGSLSAGAVSERSHGEAAWKNTVVKQLISYQEAAGLSLSLPG